MKEILDSGALRPLRQKRVIGSSPRRKFLIKNLLDVMKRLPKSDATDLERHIHSQAKQMRQNSPFLPIFKVMSDIDDTFISSLLDWSYPRGTTYPGVLAFYSEMARATRSPLHPIIRGVEASGLIFLTARPKSLVHMTHRTLTRKGVNMERATVVFGSIWKLLSHASMAQKKLENYLAYRNLYPEFDFVFLGDRYVLLRNFSQDLLLIGFL